MAAAAQDETPHTTTAEHLNEATTMGRIVQYAGAIIATAFALWFLFGIPAYLLFGIFFD